MTNRAKTNDEFERNIIAQANERFTTTARADELDQRILLEADLRAAEARLAHAINSGIGGRMLALYHEERAVAQKALMHAAQAAGILEAHERSTARRFGVRVDSLRIAERMRSISATTEPIITDQDDRIFGCGR